MQKGEEKSTHQYSIPNLIGRSFGQAGKGDLSFAGRQTCTRAPVLSSFLWRFFITVEVKQAPCAWASASINSSFLAAKVPAAIIPRVIARKEMATRRTGVRFFRERESRRHRGQWTNARSCWPTAG